MAATSVNVRVAVRDDGEAIAAVHTASWRSTYRGALRDAYLDGDVASERRRAWQERLLTPAPNQYVLVAVRADELIGFACAYACDDERFGTQLDNLHVRGDRQGEGTGGRLVAALAEWCAATHPGTGLYLWVYDQNHAARRFYDRLGGHDAGGDVWNPPDGSTVPVRRYVWTAEEVQRLASNRLPDVR